MYCHWLFIIVLVHDRIELWISLDPYSVPTPFHMLYHAEQSSPSLIQEFFFSFSFYGCVRKRVSLYAAFNTSVIKYSNTCLGSEFYSVHHMQVGKKYQPIASTIHYHSLSTPSLSENAELVSLGNVILQKKRCWFQFHSVFSFTFSNNMIKHFMSLKETEWNTVIYKIIRLVSDILLAGCVLQSHIRNQLLTSTHLGIFKSLHWCASPAQTLIFSTESRMLSYTKWEVTSWSWNVPGIQKISEKTAS